MNTALKLSLMATVISFFASFPLLMLWGPTAAGWSVGVAASCLALFLVLTIWDEL